MERHLKVNVLEPDKFIKANDCKSIINPVYFLRDGVPTSDGLLSNEIFGITKDERAGIYAYIDLVEDFMHPLYYKIFSSVNKNIIACVHGTKKFIITPSGDLEENENGESGIKFLKKNIDKIKLKSTDSNKRDQKLVFLKKNMNKAFIKQMIVIPAYYRDVNTDRGYIGVGEINKLYNQLLIAVRSLKESADYGLSMSDATRGRIQEILLSIYNWFGAGTTLDGQKTPINLPSKMGIIRRAGHRKTTDYASRLVMSSPEINVETLEEMDTTLDYSTIPLSSIIVNFYPFVLFNVRRFFENEFGADGSYGYINKEGKPGILHVSNFQVEFSDDRIQKEANRFIHGFSNRLIPIKIPNKEGKNIYMHFKGYNVDKEKFNPKEPGQMPIVSRRLTWCDIFYIAACEAVKDRCVLITRYPIDSMFNQFPTMVHISTMTQTEPMVINNTSYTKYPRIREEDIGSDTSNRFIDTMNICNAYLKGIGGDYDGDQVTVKAAFADETNEELRKHMQSKSHYIDFGCKNIRVSSNEAVQALYSMTLTLPGTELTKNIV